MFATAWSQLKSKISSNLLKSSADDKMAVKSYPLCAFA